jgi:hypothetical protein
LLKLVFLKKGMTEKPHTINDSLYRLYEPQNITVQHLAELLPFVVSEWNISDKNGYVSKKCIEEIEKGAPHLRRYFGY